MALERNLSTMKELMTQFSRDTGLSSDDSAPRRYLWTDAFAVCNFLELYRRTLEKKYVQLALLLVDQVHGLLGRHREDDSRTGWISGLPDQEGRAHPTAGGLRIGKKWSERRPSDPFDDDLEWDRDGQYYHYLTKWMHALNRVSRVTGDWAYRVWAMELARTAHARFTYVSSPGDVRRMYWKMSIDLSYPLVASMGHHDPLDGFVTYGELMAAAAADSTKFPPCPDLSREIEELADMCQGRSWATDDPLGIGGLLSAAYLMAQMVAGGTVDARDLLETVLDDSRIGLVAYARTRPLALPAHRRLAFRELALAIGLQAVVNLSHLIERESARFRDRYEMTKLVEAHMKYLSYADEIERFWLDPANRNAIGFSDHLDINMVMLATSLSPNGYLEL